MEFPENFAKPKKPRRLAGSNVQLDAELSERLRVIADKEGTTFRRTALLLLTLATDDYDRQRGGAAS